MNEYRFSISFIFNTFTTVCHTHSNNRVHKKKRKKTDQNGNKYNQTANNNYCAGAKKKCRIEWKCKEMDNTTVLSVWVCVFGVELLENKWHTHTDRHSHMNEQNANFGI